MAVSEARSRKQQSALEPPEHLSAEVAEVWRQVVTDNQLAPGAVPAASLEAYCTLVVRWRDAARRIAEEGMVVDGGTKGAVVHPALAAERQLAEQIREWAPTFKRPVAKRKPGPMYNATKASVAASQVLQDKRFRGAVEAVKTLAWLIDEAQREGVEALQKAAVVLIPSYLKGCAALRITPASLPATRPAGVPAPGASPAVGGGKVSKFSDAAARRRGRATG